MPGTHNSGSSSATAPSVRLHGDGSFDLSLGGVTIRRCYPGIDHEPLRVAGVHVAADSILYDLAGPTVRLTFARCGSMLEIRTRLEGFAAAPRWFAPICGGLLGGVDRLYRTGVGFSGPSGIVPLAAAGGLVSYDSYLATGLIAADGACLAMATPDQRRFVQQVRVANRQVRGNFRNRELRENNFLLHASFSTEAIALGGAALDLPPIVLAGADRCWDALRELGRRIAADRSVRLAHRPCYHCCTWYRRGPFLTLGDLEAALDSAVERQAGFRYVQIDDGYAPFAGDWLEADEGKWPGGLPRALEAIRARGFRPGIWVAPFMVASRSRLFREHPDWVLRGLDGRCVVQWRSDLGERASEEHYALDSSHPDALEYLRRVFATMRGWGAEFVKTDFMEWGFPDPARVRRYAPGRTSAEYFDEVCRTIRQEIGQAYWLGCITYFAPSVGYVDGMRVSSDCGAGWPDDDPPGPDGAEGGTPNVVSETLGCHWMNGLLWQNDPDVTFLRRVFTRLREHEAEALAFWHGLLGVSINTSDWFGELDEGGLALWRFLRPADRPWTAEMPFWEDHFGGLAARRPVFTVVRKYDHGGWAVLWLNPTGREQLDHVTVAELTGRDELFAHAWSHRGSRRLGPCREFTTRLGPHHARLVYLSTQDQPPPTGLTLGGALPAWTARDNTVYCAARPTMNATFTGETMIPQHMSTVVVIAGLLAFAGYQAFAAEAGTKPAKENYALPFEPATRAALLPLPPGAIEPQGWLRDWCVTAGNGYTGHMDDVHVAFKQAWAADYKMTGDKLFWPNGGWPYEGGGYWFDGLARLGFAMHDQSLINQAKTRLDAVINNMNENGILFLWWLNKNNPDDVKAAEGRQYRESEWPVWSSGLLGRAMAGYYAGSGDARALRALEAAYSNSAGWATMECWGVSNAWPAYQTYRWTGNKKIAQALDALFAQPGDEKKEWSFQRYRRMPSDKPGAEKPDHVVHFLETTSAAAVGYLWTGKKEYLDAVLAWNDMVERDCMQPNGVIVADEFYGPTGAFRSTETCDVSASIWSHILLLGITGQAAMADNVERAFFNAGPATVARDFKTHVYFQSPNRMADKSLPKPGQCTYARSHQPLCCTAAANRFLPHYVTHMWMATYDNGLAAVHYGPCQVSALAGDGVPVRITCRTDYPFNESIEMTVKPAKETAFPLSLRIPGWCKKPAVAVNGTAIDAKPDAKGFIRLARSWKDGDTIRLELPMSVQVATGTDKNLKPAAPYATVSYGPLLFALAIADTKTPNTPDPAARWNYALDAAADITVQRSAMPAAWDWPLESPLKLRASAVSFDWKPTHEAGLPTAPVAAAAAGEAAKITLIPYGCTKFRVSMFPVTERTAK